MTEQVMSSFCWPEELLTRTFTAQDNVEPLRRETAPYWMTYSLAAAYLGITVAYLRNLVSADAIPVYGKPRERRFRRDMLDCWQTNRDAAMRKFRAERDAQNGN